MIVEIPKGAKTISLKGGQKIEVPANAKTLEIPDDLMAGPTKEQEVKFWGDSEVNKLKVNPNLKEYQENSQSLWEKTKERVIKPAGSAVQDVANFVLPTEVDFMGENYQGNEIRNDMSEMIGLTDEVNRIDDKLLSNIDSLARTDIRLIGDATKEQKDSYTNNIASILHKAGYDLGQAKDGRFVAVNDNGETKEITNNFFDGMLDSLSNDKFEIGGAIAGSAKGIKAAKSLPNPFAKAAVILGYGAVGAMSGTAVDTAISNYKTGQKFEIEDYLNELSKSAVLDAVGTGVGYGVIKVGGKAIDTPKKLYDHIIGDNINGAKEVLKKDLKIDDKYIDEALKSATQSIKETSKYQSGLNNITGNGKKQEEILATLQANQEFGTDIIKEAIDLNPTASTNLAHTINDRTKNLINTFNDVKIDGSEVKNSVNNYETKVKKQYSEMRDVYKKSFENSDFRFTLNDLKIKDTLDNLSPKVSDPLAKDKFEQMNTSIQAIIKDISDGSGVVKDMDSLLDIRQQMNKFYRKNEKAFELAPDKMMFKNMISSIDGVVETGIKEHLPQETHQGMIKLFDDARDEYAQMYKIRDTKLYKTLMDKNLSSDKRLENLAKHTADDEEEFATLLKKLPYEDQQRIENSIVSKFLDDSLLGHSKELQAVDYEKLTTKIKDFEKFFITDSGKESVSLIKDMSNKFGNDLELLKASKKGMKLNTNAGIATTITGRIEYLLAKVGFDRVMRVVPFGDGAKRKALRYHVRVALEKSRTPVELAKKVLVAPDLPISTKKDLRELISDYQKMKKLKNDEEALLLEKELESKLISKQTKEKKIQSEIDTFKAPSTVEANIVEQLTSSDKYGSFSHVVREVQGKEPNSVSIEKYIRAKNDIDAKVLDNFILEDKYPISKAMITRLDKLKNFDKSKMNNIVTDNEFKSLIYHLKKDTVPGTTDKLKVQYKEKFFKLNKLFDELEDDIDFTYAVDNNLVPFAKFSDNLLAGTLSGIQTDEDGNIKGFDPVSFVVGMGGYTAAKSAAKYLVKKHKPQVKIADKIQSFIESTEEEMAKMAGGGKPPLLKDEHGFYSVLEDLVSSKVGGKIDSVSLTKMLEKNGVKKDELKWSGLEELISTNEKLTKEQIGETIKENRLVIEVINKDMFLNEQLPKGYSSADKSAAKYQDYKISGGDNYRELLFRQSNIDSNFKSDHWAEGNILTFTRVDDRIIDNKKTLFIEELQSDWHQMGRKKGYGSKKIPDAPFKKSWVELGLKRMVQEAVSKDYEKIAWTTGLQQAKRYSLEKEVDMLVYNKQTGFIVGTNKGEEIIFKKVASDEEVETIMGKELTKRLINPISTTKDDIYVLQGDELKFGGDGMKTFYDEIVPNTVKKLFKKYNVKPKIEELDDLDEMVWSIEITAKMKEDIKKYGQPLYAAGGTMIANEAITNQEEE